MRLLLDTHIWLWTILSPERIRKPVRDRLESGDEALFLSAASAWELAIKYHIGKLALPAHPRDFIAPRLVRDRIASLPVDHAHAVEVAGLPDHHADPFDRLLIAQCKVEGLALVTADRKLAAYDFEVVWAD